MKKKKNKESNAQDSNPRGRWLLIGVLAGIILAVLTTLFSESSTVSIEPDNYEIYEHEVEAINGWQTTGIELSARQSVEIEYVSGEWTSYEPEGIYGADGGTSYICAGDCVEVISPGVPQGQLIGRIGNEGSPFAIGNYLSFTAEEDGTLFLRINDGDIGLDDNFGAVNVHIKLR